MMRTLAGLPLRKRLFLVAALYAGLALSLVPWMPDNPLVWETQLWAATVAVFSAPCGWLPQRWLWYGLWVTVGLLISSLFEVWGYTWQHGGNPMPAVLFGLVSVAAWTVVLAGGGRFRAAKPHDDKREMTRT